MFRVELLFAVILACQAQTVAPFPCGVNNICSCSGTANVDLRLITCNSASSIDLSSNGIVFINADAFDTATYLNVL